MLNVSEILIVMLKMAHFKIEYIQILFIVSYLRNIVIYDTKSVTSYGLLLQIFQVLYFLFYDPRMHQSFTFHYL